MHRIAALCLPQLVAFDLSVVAEVFSLAYRRGKPLYEFTACAESPGRIATTTGFGDRRAGRPRSGPTPRTRCSSRATASSGAARSRDRRSAARRARARGEGRLDLHRRVRARARRPPGRPPRDDPLVRRRRARADVPRRSTSTPDVLYTRGRARPDFGRPERRDRPLPSHRPDRPRRGPRRRSRSGDGRLAASRRRPGAVHRAADTPVERRPRRRARVGSREPRRPARRHRARVAGRDESSPLRQAVSRPRRDRRRFSGSSQQRVREAGACSRRPTCRSRRSRSGRDSARRRRSASTSGARWRPARRRIGAASACLSDFSGTHPG